MNSFILMAHRYIKDHLAKGLADVKNNRDNNSIRQC